MRIGRGARLGAPRLNRLESEGAGKPILTSDPASTHCNEEMSTKTCARSHEEVNSRSLEAVVN